MKDGYIRTAAATPAIRVADPEYNAGQIMTQIDEAVAKGAKIIVFPELCITGYTCGDLFLQDRLLSGAREALHKIIKHTEKIQTDAVIFVGLPMEWRGKLYNCAAVINRGELQAIVPKKNIPDYAEFYEGRHFTPGAPVLDYGSSLSFEGDDVDFGTDVVFDLTESVPGLVIGCEICEDAWVPDAPDIDMALAGATIIVNLSASSAVVGKNDYVTQLITGISARTVTGYIYACAGEGESTQDLVFPGHNIIAENGVILAETDAISGGLQSPVITNGIIYADIDLARICHERRRISSFRAERQGMEKVLQRNEFLEMKQTDLKLERRYDPRPFVPADDSMREKRCLEIVNIQALGLRKRLIHTGCRSVVLGLSGGLDSTLALIVCARAFDMLHLDRKGIVAVTMPGFGTTDRTYSNAKALAKAYGTTLKEISIAEAVTVHFKDIGQKLTKHDVTYENSQARERTQILMDLANKLDAMVVGTGDLSELALGWATYNGDHMSMYDVNGGVPKTLVRHLVSFEAMSTDDRKLRSVLLDILDTPVSPELLPPADGKISQQTEDLVGPYELHDFFLYYMLRLGFTPAKIFRIAVPAFEGVYDANTVKKWLKVFYRRFFSQQFKRSCMPDGPKVGSVALSPRGDLRMPSDASAALWMKEAEAL